MGWLGELSSMVLGRILSGGDRCNSDSASEIERLVKLEQVDHTYQPTEQSVIDQLYEPVEPCDLISKQQTTMIYLTKSKTNHTVSARQISDSTNFVI